MKMTKALLLERRRLEAIKALGMTESEYDLYQEQKGWTPQQWSEWMMGQAIRDEIEQIEWRLSNDPELIEKLKPHVLKPTLFKVYYDEIVAGRVSFETFSNFSSYLSMARG